MVTPEQVNAANRVLSWINLFKPWALAFVAIGVAYEFIADRLERPYNKLLDAAHDEEMAQLRNSNDSLRKDMAASIAREKEADARIAEAQRDAAEAQRSLALAEQHSAEANAKAEGFRLEIAKANESAKQAEARAAEANLELARFKAPRTLSPSQQASIAARLRPFGTNRVDVIIIGDAQEIADITRDIVTAIQQAAWTAKVIGKAISGPNVSGVLIGTHIGSDRNVIEAAETLISALQSSGIVSSRFTPQFDDELPMAIMGVWDKNNVAPIRILVSAKP